MYDYHKWVELCDFSEAPESMYGACIYLRSIEDKDNTVTHLLCAKFKIPLVKIVSLIELYAPILLPWLANMASKVFEFNNWSISLEWFDDSIDMDQEPIQSMEEFCSQSSIKNSRIDKWQLGACYVQRKSCWSSFTWNWPCTMIKMKSLVVWVFLAILGSLKVATSKN